MSLKRTDLAKKLNLKIQGQMQHAAVPNRFAQAAALPDRRERRKLDQAAGLVPFAVKLNRDLVARLGELAAARQVPLNALVDELLRAGLSQLPSGTAVAAAAEPAPAAPKAPARKAATQPAATKTARKAAVKVTEETPKKAAVKKASAPKAAAEKPASKTASKTAKKAAR